MSEPIRILLADDHAILRHGVRRILEAEPGLTVIAEASSGLDAIQAASTCQPDVAIMDIGMQQLNGIEATTQLLHRSPRTAVLILSMYSDERYVLRAVRAGAKGYLLKDSVEQDLLQAVRAVAAGGSYFSPSVGRVLVDNFATKLKAHQPEDRYELLTDRERQIYQLLAEGKSNKEIAALLLLSIHTVETHRVRVMEKMDVHSSAELVLSAVRRGLVT